MTNKFRADSWSRRDWKSLEPERTKKARLRNTASGYTYITDILNQLIFCLKLNCDVK